MELVERTIEYTHTDEVFNLYAIGDIHEGNRGCNLEKLKKDVTEVEKDDKGLWVNLGDNIDAIVPSDRKRFDPSTIDPKYLNDLDNLPTKQMDTVLEVLEPIKDKCLGFLRGNHEEAVRKYHHFDVISGACYKWGVPNLKDLAFIRLRFKRKSNNQKTKAIEYRIHSSRRTRAYWRSQGRFKGQPIRGLDERV